MYQLRNRCNNHSSRVETHLIAGGAVDFFAAGGALFLIVQHGPTRVIALLTLEHPLPERLCISIA